MTSYILHIGDRGCGGSAIAHALDKAAGNLAEAGLLYESAATANAHHHLISLIGRRAGAARNKQLTSAKNSIRKIRSGCKAAEYVLLSAEWFMQVGPVRVLNLLAMIDRHIEQVHVIAYVRKPTNMYLALVEQQLERDHLFTLPCDYERRSDQLIKAWEEHPRISSLKVSSIDDECFHAGRVVNNFESALNDIVGDKKIKLQRAAEVSSLSAEQMVIMQKLRHVECADFRSMSRPESNKLKRAFDSMNRRKRFGCNPVLSIAVNIAVSRHASGVITELNKRYPNVLLDASPEQALSDKHLKKRCPESNDVSSILKRVDQRLVDILCNLIPAINTSLRINEGGTAAASLKDALEYPAPQADDFLDAIESYWAAEGCTGAVMQLRVFRSEGLSELNMRTHTNLIDLDQYIDIVQRGWPRLSFVRSAIIYPILPLPDARGRFQGGVVEGNEGTTVPESMLKRRNNQIVRPPDVDRYKTIGKRAVEGRCVFGGYLIKHYGHFLLETLSRIWALTPQRYDRILWCPIGKRGGFSTFEIEILRLFGLDQCEHVIVNEVLEIEHLEVPAPGYTIQTHANVEHMKSLATYRGSTIIPGKKLWLSRSSLGGGGWTNESQVEAQLVEEGWTIFRPEEHPLEVQLEELSSSDRIAGLAGSAFHTLILCQSIRARIDIFSRAKKFNNNFVTIGRARGWEQHMHISPVRVIEQNGSHSILELLDLDFVLNTLHTPAAALPCNIPLPYLKLCGGSTGYENVLHEYRKH